MTMNGAKTEKESGIVGSNTDPVSLLVPEEVSWLLWTSVLYPGKGDDK